ncbi:hypothetical protein BC628DRAFT_1022912 [Trametes gibbosa]|nr:hypothetical protein BC628DRAFT_1022912 [Trametes gibbosa]
MYFFLSRAFRSRVSLPLLPPPPSPDSDRCRVRSRPRISPPCTISRFPRIRSPDTDTITDTDTRYIYDRASPHLLRLPALSNSPSPTYCASVGPHTTPTPRSRLTPSPRHPVYLAGSSPSPPCKASSARTPHPSIPPLQQPTFVVCKSAAVCGISLPPAAAVHLCIVRR